MEKMKLLLSGKNDPLNWQNYIDAVNGVGAEAVAGYLPEADTSFDGLILCGGSDIHPREYGQENNGSIKIDENRDAAEFALLKAFVEAGKPVLGICRGMQLINIYFGGTLYQDIPEAELHKKHNGIDSVHSVTADADSILGKLYGRTFAVNSAHHQALDALGTGLRETARWNDQYVEAIEHTQYPIFAVQWHPERTCFANKREDTVDGAAIFETFIAMCQNKA